MPYAAAKKKEWEQSHRCVRSTRRRDQRIAKQRAAAKALATFLGKWWAKRLKPPGTWLVRTDRATARIANKWVELALKSNWIKPGPCALCGAVGKNQGHHPDYNQPALVIWLCPSCHRQEHIRIDAMLDGPKNKPERKLRKNAGLSAEERAALRVQKAKEWALKNKDLRNAKRNDLRKRKRAAGIAREPGRQKVKNLFD